MKIALKDIHPNPFRNLQRLPLDAAKVASLRESIKATTFWDNTLMARKSAGGSIELVFGHHRLEAAIQELGRNAEVDIKVHDIDDPQMMKRMARENSAAWGMSFGQTEEIITATLEGYAAGKWELEKPTVVNREGVRFCRESSHDKSGPYTSATLATFTGLEEYAVKKALFVLDAVTGAAKGDDALPKGVVTQDDLLKFEKASDGGVAAPKVVAKLITEVKKATAHLPTFEQKREQAKATIAAITELRRDVNPGPEPRPKTGTKAQPGFRRFAAAAAKSTVYPRKPKPTDWNAVAFKFAEALAKLFKADSPDTLRLQDIVNHGDEVSARSATAILQELHRISNITAKLADRLEGKQETMKKRLLLTSGKGK